MSKIGIDHPLSVGSASLTQGPIVGVRCGVSPPSSLAIEVASFPGANKVREWYPDKLHYYIGRDSSSRSGFDCLFFLDRMNRWEDPCITFESEYVEGKHYSGLTQKLKDAVQRIYVYCVASVTECASLSDDPEEMLRAISNKLSQRILQCESVRTQSIFGSSNIGMGRDRLRFCWHYKLKNDRHRPNLLQEVAKREQDPKCVNLYRDQLIRQP